MGSRAGDRQRGEDESDHSEENSAQHNDQQNLACSFNFVHVTLDTISVRDGREYSTHRHKPRNQCSCYDHEADDPSSVLIASDKWGHCYSQLQVQIITWGHEWLENDGCNGHKTGSRKVFKASTGII